MNRFINLHSSIGIGMLIFAVLMLTAPASAQTIKIMPLGDSITRGVENLTPTDDDNGYRDDLATLLDAAGLNYDFVGRLTNPVTGATFDANHEGNNGQRADQLLGQMNTILNANVPDIVLLHIGTNDISNGDANSSTILEISQIVDAIKNKNSNTKIILSSILPRTDSPNFDDNTTALNALIEDLVQSKRGAGVKIWYAGMNEIFRANSNFATDYFTPPDGVHPNDTGYGIMAQVWLDLILIAQSSTDIAVSDNFERAGLGITWHSDGENVIQSGDLINKATSGSNRWDYMSTYRNQKNPNRVSVKWSLNADANGIANGGLALLLNEPTRTADGYMAYISPSDNILRLWTINNGNTDQDTDLEKLSTAPAPQPGDVFRVDVTVGANLVFEYFVNDVSGGTITVTNPPALPSSLYSGVIFNHSQANDVEEFSVIKFSDTNPPAAITNLATGNVTATSVSLSWNAVGDDGLEGQAASYDLRYSTSNITSQNFASATQVTGVPAPGASGAAQSHTVGGLLSGTTYFFAIKAKDEAGTAGPISNVVSASTPAGNLNADNFDRLDLGPNWTVDPGYQIVTDVLSNTSSSELWDELAIYSARKNPIEVQFTWADDAGATGIDQAGFAIVSGSASPNASGYVISRRSPNQQLRLWNVIGGVVTTTIHIFGDGGGETLLLPAPVAGDVVRIVISTDGVSNHFDFYKNDEFDARVTDPNLTYDLTQDYWAGVALRANNPGGVAINNNIDNFQLLLTPSPPSKLVLISGDNQSAMVGQQLPDPIVVRITDDSDIPISGVNVHFVVTSGSGSVDVPPPSPNIVIETEAGALTSPMVVGNDGTASKGKFIHVPDGQGGAQTGKATYTFNVEVGGDYYLWGRAITPDVQGDVFNIKIDNGTDYFWDVGQRAFYGQPWFWDQVSHRGTGTFPPSINPVTVNLTAGIHTLTIREGKDGAKIDQFLLTRDLAFVPTNIQEAGGTFTDVNGDASAHWTMGASVGPGTVEARFAALTPVVFNASATGGPPTAINKISGDNQNGLVAPGSPLPAPFVVELRDAFGNLNLNYPVTFTVISGNGTMGTPNPVNTDPVTGRAQNTLTLATDTGVNQVQVTATGYVGPDVIFSASPTAGNPTALSLVGGNNQTGTAGFALAQQFQVKVVDSISSPVNNHPITFTVTGGGGKFNDNNQITVNTLADGIASATLTLGPTPGATNTAQATASFNSAPLSGSPINFTATAATPTTLQAVSPLTHNGTANLPLADSIKVRVRDAQNNPLPNYPVTFTVILGGGKVNGSDNINRTTNSSGIASVQWRLGSVAGQNNNKIRASATFNSNPLSGSPIEFMASAGTSPAKNLVKVSGDDQSGQIQNPLAEPFVVRVTDESNNTISGWPVDFEVTAGGGNFGGETSITVNTDGNGLASPTLTLGSEAGTPENPFNNRVTVSSENNGPLVGSPITFRASAIATGAKFLDLVAGGGQSGQAGLPLAQKIQVTVTDATHTNAINNHPVTFKIFAGGGTINGTAAGDTLDVVNTNSSGIAEVTWYLGGVRGDNNQKLRVTANDGINPLTGSPLDVLATATTGPVDAEESFLVANPISVLANGTSVSTITVTITDKFGNPIGGKVVFITSSGSNNTISAPQATHAQTGVATFTIASTKAEVKSINATVTPEFIELANPVNVEFTALEPKTIVVNSGNNQTANKGTAVENPIEVLIRDINNNPVSGVPVDFEALTGGGFIITESISSQNSIATAATTNEAGIASATWVLGPNPGANTTRATASFSGNPLNGSPVNFSATAVDAIATQMQVFGGFPQTGGAAGKPLPIPLQVKVMDASGKAVAAVNVAFNITEGGGSLANGNPVSDFRGIAQTEFTLGPTVGINRVTARNDALSGSPINFQFQSVVGRPAILTYNSPTDGQGSGVAGTTMQISVKITDLFGNAVPGMHAGFVVQQGGAVIQGSSDATTNSSGVAGVTLQLPNLAGIVQVRATSDDLPGFYKDFEIDVVAGSATTLVLEDGNNQEGTIGRELVFPLQVKVTDTHGNVVSGFNVPWVVTLGGGSLANASTLTDENGIASNKLALGGTPGTNSAVAVTALNPSQIVFNATGVTNRFPLFSGLTDKTVTEGNPLSFQVLAQDADGDPITYSAQGLPTGASFNANTRTLNWTPGVQQSGEYSVTFTAQDDKGGSDVESIKITINNSNQPPVITNFSPTSPQFNVVWGEVVNFSVTASDQNSDPLSYRWDLFTPSNPNGTLVSTSPQFNFNTQQFDQGSYTVRVEVSDGQDKVENVWLSDVILSVELSSFSANFGGFDGVKISWATSREVDNTGFNVLRSVSEKGTYTQINEELIKSSGNGQYDFFDRTVEVGQTYFYKLEDVDIRGLKKQNGPISILVTAPETFELSQNYPNPFNPETKIRFQLPNAGKVVLKVFDVLGREVRVLVDDRKDAGFHDLTWDARDNFGQRVSSGVYYYQIVSGEFRQTKRMVLLK